MPLIETNFTAPAFMANGHFQTLYPYFFRKVNDLAIKRERIDLHDGDFLDLDIVDVNGPSLVVLTHGLEGSSTTGYMRGMAKHLSEATGNDVVAWNMRSCSGELNRKDFFYHAASCHDLSAVIDYMKSKKKYSQVHIIGFSLGGNLTAFYASTVEEQKLSSIDSAIIFSSTLHLESSIKKLKESQIGTFYSENFLTTMRKKALEKQALGLLDVDPQQIKNCKHFRDFDELITAPTNGFKNAKHYYEEASAINVIHKARVPTLFLQSKDDPFLTKECFPMRQAHRSKNIHLEITPTGGHVGFMTFDKKLLFWGEERAAQFIKEIA
jgi:hypothetical protein